MNFSFATLQASNHATALVARVNTQIGQAAALDEQPDGDQAPGQRGEVLLDQADSFIQLSYDPATNAPKSFAFQANQNLLTPEGQVVVPAGTQSSYSAADGKESFSLQVPGEGGAVSRQQATLDNSAGMLLFSDGTAQVEVPFSTLPAAQATTALVQKLQLQIAQTAALDEQAGVDLAAGQPGQVSVQDAGSTVSLNVDAVTGMPKAFAFKAIQSLTAEDGSVVVPAGLETSYERLGLIETFRQDVPTEQGIIRQQAVLNNAEQTVDFQEFLLNA